MLCYVLRIWLSVESNLTHQPGVHVAELSVLNCFPKNAKSSCVAVLKGKEGLNKFNEPQSRIFARIVANHRYHLEKERIFFDFLMAPVYLHVYI